MGSDDGNTELREHCRQVVKLTGLRQGHVEIHCHDGEPKNLHICDKSIKFETNKRGR